MVSSVGSLSGLSAADIQSLFGAIGADTPSSSSSSSSSNPTTTGAAQSASTPVAAASPNDPINAIKSILAQAQVGGGPPANIGSIATAEAAYAAQAGGSNSQIGVSATTPSPAAAQQIAQAVADINNAKMLTQTLAPPNNQGIIDYVNVFSVSASDAVNITMSGGAITSAATQGSSALANGIPSASSIQQAINLLAGVNGTPNGGSAYDGSLTLVKLPPDALGGIGGNIATFDSNNGWADQWALVLPQASLNASASPGQASG